MTGKRTRLARSIVLLMMLAISWGCASGGQMRAGRGGTGLLGGLTYPYFLWTDAWYTDPGDKRYFDIDGLMAEFELSRFQAAELQNQYRDNLFEFCRERDCKNRVDDPRWTTIEDFSCLDQEDRK